MRIKQALQLYPGSSAQEVCKNGNSGHLLVNILKFELKLPFLLVTLGHHLVEVGLDLDHLSIQTAELLIWFPCLLVHDLSFLYFK